MAEMERLTLLERLAISKVTCDEIATALQGELDGASEVARVRTEDYIRALKKASAVLDWCGANHHRTKGAQQ